MRQERLLIVETGRFGLGHAQKRRAGTLRLPLMPLMSHRKSGDKVRRELLRSHEDKVAAALAKLPIKECRLPNESGCAIPPRLEFPQPKPAAFTGDPAAPARDAAATAGEATATARQPVAST